jgi:HPt (histidine-containing phosphotransfer) domain-containing protein
MGPEAAAWASSDERRRRTTAAMTVIWREAKPGVLEQVGVIEDAARALGAGDLGDELRERAHGEAHKLAGSLGTFGFIAPSRLARRLEHLLDEEAVQEADPPEVTEIAAALRAEVEACTTPQLSGPPRGSS